MDTQILHSKYFTEGTPGFATIRKFYRKYGDVLIQLHYTNINDVVHEVFLSLSRTDFTHVQNEEHYVMRAIKLHCWSLLDKAIRQKAVVAEDASSNSLDETETNVGLHTVPADRHDHLAQIEGMELLSYVNLFKTLISERDARLLNLLIDEASRAEMSRLLELNMNTLDTHIRRLRIKLVEYLKSLGYTYKALERFD